MRFHAARPGYDVLVRGTFLDPSGFEIHALVQHDKSVTDGERESLMREARLELMFAIVRESERGRRLGARRVFVVVDGDDDLAQLFRVRDEPEAPAPLRVVDPVRAPRRSWLFR